MTAPHFHHILAACLAQHSCPDDNDSNRCLHHVGQCLLQQSSAPRRRSASRSGGGGPFEQGLYAPAANRQLVRTLGSEYTIGRGGVDETSEDGGGYDYGEFPGQLE